MPVNVEITLNKPYLQEIVTETSAMKETNVASLINIFLWEEWLFLF
jgi:hypothetical protein